MPADGTNRPIRGQYVRVSSLLTVFLGGVFGTSARAAIDSAIGSTGDVPAGTLVVNITGSIALGLLLEALLRRPQLDGFQRLRLLLGTGFLGAFTTYSALAVETASLFEDGLTTIALGYSLASVVLGIFAAAAGIALGILTHRHHDVKGPPQ